MNTEGIGFRAPIKVFPPKLLNGQWVSAIEVDLGTAHPLRIMASADEPIVKLLYAMGQRLVNKYVLIASSQGRPTMGVDRSRMPAFREYARGSDDEVGFDLGGYGAPAGGAAGGAIGTAYGGAPGGMIGSRAGALLGSAIESASRGGSSPMGMVQNLIAKGQSQQSASIAAQMAASKMQSAQKLGTLFPGGSSAPRNPLSAGGSPIKNLLADAGVGNAAALAKIGAIATKAASGDLGATILKTAMKTAVNEAQAMQLARANFPQFLRFVKGV